MAALAIILGYVEMLLPVFFVVPGMKLGLANLVTVFVLYRYRAKEAAVISLIRIVVIGFLFANLFSILYSLAGAALSLLCMTAARRFSGLSIVGVSILGGVTHNLGQLIVAGAFGGKRQISSSPYSGGSCGRKRQCILLLSGAFDFRSGNRGAYRDCDRRNFKENDRKEINMIAYIKGVVAEIWEDRIILESQNMGYNIFMPMASVDTALHTGEEAKIYTYLNVREDAMQLFGFLTKDDLNTFKLLLSVNGIGPKAALGVLSGLSADELRFAVLADDVKTISKAPGIGKKTAQKLILELKDKLDLQEAFQLKTQHVQETGSDTADLSGMRKEAVEALTALGYSGADALRAVKKVELTADMNVEALLKAALKNMF